MTLRCSTQTRENYSYTSRYDEQMHIPCTHMFSVSGNLRGGRPSADGVAFSNVFGGCIASRGTLCAAGVCSGCGGKLQNAVCHGAYVHNNMMTKHLHRPSRARLDHGLVVFSNPVRRSLTGFPSSPLSNVSQGKLKHVIPGLDVEAPCKVGYKPHRNTFGGAYPCRGMHDETITREELTACLPDKSPACIPFLPPLDPALRRCA